MSIKIINYKDEYKKDLKRMIIALRQFELDVDDWKYFKLDKEYGKKTIENLLKNVKEKKGKIYLAKLDGKNIGFVAGWIVPMNKENFQINNLKRGFVDELYLDKKYRGMGIGKELLEKIEEHFRKNKCDTIGLNIVAANKGAMEFYDKKGFEKRTMFLSKALNKKVKK